MADKAEQPSGDPPPAKQAKAEAEKPAKKVKQPKLPKQPKQPKQDDGLYLPVLAELTYTSSVIFLILVFLAMAVVSWLTGTGPLDFVLRTSVAMAVLGSLLLVVSRQVSAGVLSVSQAEIEEKRRDEAPQQLDIMEDPQLSEQPKSMEVPESVGIETSLNVEAQ